MIVKHERKGGIDVYYVKKNISDAGMEKHKHQFVTPSLIDIIINDDADVYTDDNRLLLKFRKGKLSKDKIDAFYENMIDFARTKSTNRRLTSGIRTKSRSKKAKTEKDVAAMTNIVGYFDSLGPSQKALLPLPLPTLPARCGSNAPPTSNKKWPKGPTQMALG